MSDKSVKHKKRQAAWYKTLAGQSSLDKLDDFCTETLSEIFGYYAIEMGVISEQHSLLQHSRITTGFTLFDVLKKSKPSLQFGHKPNVPSTVISTPERLPIATDNIDLVIASHTLESSQDPHQVLREIDRVLVPEGHCILIGFNPFSVSQVLMQFGRSIKSRFNKDDSAYKAPSVVKVRDWFSLLGFEVVDVRYIGVRPDIKNTRIFEGLNWMERLGEYAGPMLGNMYVIHAKKQMIAMRPDKKVWRAPAVLSGGKVVLNNTAQKIRRQNFSKL